MSDVTVLISSFDGFSDCWLPVAHGFKKYWPDCPYPVLLMTNTKDFSHEGVSVLKVGGGRDWSGRMITALDRITTPYVMYFQEDYWINAPVDTSRVLEYAALMEKHGLNYIRLLAFPEPDRDLAGDPRLGMIALDASYRTSVQISLWRREIFRELVRAGESVWQFELQGTERSRRYGDTFASVKSKDRDPYYHGIRYVCTAINSGKWSRAAKAYARQEGLPVDFSNLPSETWWDDFKRSGAIGAAVKLWAHRLHLVFCRPKAAVQHLRARFRRGAAYPAWLWWRNRRQVRLWEREGRVSPPPQPVKYSVIREYARRFALRVFVETGTYFGDAVQANLSHFDRLYSIELGEELHGRATKRFARWDHVTILHGDSARVLPEVLRDVHQPTLFWLDGHYSEGITARGDKETPIEAELRAIFMHPEKNHVILIDDARCFTGTHDYPALPDLEQWVREANPSCSFEVKDDIIRICPAPVQERRPD